MAGPGLSYNGVTYNGGVNDRDAQFVASQQQDAGSNPGTINNWWTYAFSNAGNILSGAANIIAATKGSPATYSTNGPVTVNATPGGGGNNTIWIIIGVVLLLALIGFIAFKGSKKKAE